MDSNDSNDRTTAGVIAATAIIASIALLALAGRGGSICAAIDEAPEEAMARRPGLRSRQRVCPTASTIGGGWQTAAAVRLTGRKMTFGLYNVSTGGTALATDTHTAVVTDGLFNTA